MTNTGEPDTEEWALAFVGACQTCRADRRTVAELIGAIGELGCDVAHMAATPPGAYPSHDDLMKMGELTWLTQLMHLSALLVVRRLDELAAQ